VFKPKIIIQPLQYKHF